MKKLIILLAASASVLACFAQKKNVPESRPVIGQVSPDTENENGEKDPPFAHKIHPIAANDLVPSRNQGYIKDLSQPMLIAMQSAYGLMDKEIQFNILPQHKYMLNECTGIKGTTGKVSFTLPTPEVKINNHGLYFRYALDPVPIKNLNVRTSPCVNDTKCHFSSAFAVEGTISGLVLEIIANPIIDLEHCKIVSLGNPQFNWKIGTTNLKSLSPSLNQLAGNMIEDALRVNSDFILFNRLQEVLNYYLGKNPDCSRRKPIADVAYAITVNEMEPWEVMTPAEKVTKPQLEGETSPQSRTKIIIYAGNQKVTSVTRLPLTLHPGLYRIKVNNVPIDDVPIHKGKNTRLRLGFVLFTGNDWSIYDESGIHLYLSGKEKAMVTLPTGTYQLRSGDLREQKAVKDGEIIEL